MSLHQDQQCGGKILHIILLSETAAGIDLFILTNVIELYYFISLETLGMGLPHLLIITIMSYTAVDLRGNGGTIVENAESVETLGIQNR